MRNNFHWLLIGLLLAGGIVAWRPAAASAATDEDFVWGTVRLESGFYTYSKVYPVNVIEDQFFRYWVGEAEGSAFMFDPYKQIWYPPPVQYLRTSLGFRGQQVEGFTRVWGRSNQFTDESYFFGVDGAVYEQQRKYRRVGLAGRKHRRLVKEWYVNMLTGEQSDWPARTPEEEEAYAAQLRAIPEDAFPRWAEPISTEEGPPSTKPSPEITEGAGEEPAEEPAESGAEAEGETSAESTDGSSTGSQGSPQT